MLPPSPRIWQSSGAHCLLWNFSSSVPSPLEAQSLRLSVILTNHFIPIPFLHLPPKPPWKTPLPGSQSLTPPHSARGPEPPSSTPAAAAASPASPGHAQLSWTLTNSCSGVTLSRSPALESASPALRLCGEAVSGPQVLRPHGVLTSPPSVQSLPHLQALHPAYLTITLSQEKVDPASWHRWPAAGVGGREGVKSYQS